VTAVSLAGVAGFVDAAGFLTLGGLFTAHMSGNTARLGVRLGGGQLGAALPLAVAIALFVIGVMAGAAASELLMRRGGASTVAAVLTAQALLLLAFMLYGATVVGAGGDVASRSLSGFYALLALLVLSMGLQTASIQRVGGSGVRTTYVTGILTDLAHETVNYCARPGSPSYLRDVLGLGERRAARGRIGLLGGIASSYLAGAVAGAALQARWHTWAMALPLAVLLAAILRDLIAPLNR
jgi:uncharacterized membrane protein YoaK (UPF0700 family)